MNKIFLITTLAEYQTDFWAAVGLELKRRGEPVAFLSFDDRSSELLGDLGFEVFSLKSNVPAIDYSDAALDAALARFGIDDSNYWLAHEKVTFGIRDHRALQKKLLAYLLLSDHACATLRTRAESVTLVQELGGFISVVAAYFAARHRGIDNWFIEPAFFRGRMFFLKNSFAALRIDASLPAAISPQARDYIAQTLRHSAIVVPQKDKHQYTTAFKKIVNFKNLRRLIGKSVDKYILGKHQEFGHIGRHVSVHAKMLANSWRLRSRYTPLRDAGRFIYYPLHVPMDMALTLRSPRYLDQLALIEYLCGAVPNTHKVAIKEHPAMIGAMEARRLIDLLNRHDNLLMLPPATNNFSVLKATEAVISVNSKSGAEAALLRKPVIVLGDAFYRDSPLVTAVNDITTLPQTIAAVLQAPAEIPGETVERYFEAVWRQSWPGELYVSNAENIGVFTDSMIHGVRQGEDAFDPARSTIDG